MAKQRRRPRTKLDERIGRGALSTDKADISDGPVAKMSQHVARGSRDLVGDVDRGHFWFYGLLVLRRVCGAPAGFSAAHLGKPG